MRRLLRLGDWSLGAKIAAALLLLSILPIAAVTIANIHDARTHAWESETALLDARADQVVDELDRFNDGYRRAVSRLANVPEIIGLFTNPPPDLTALTHRLSVHLNNDPAVRGIALIDARGTVQAATEPELVDTIERSANTSNKRLPARP